MILQLFIFPFAHLTPSSFSVLHDVAQRSQEEKVFYPTKFSCSHLAQESSSIKFNFYLILFNLACLIGKQERFEYKFLGGNR